MAGMEKIEYEARATASGRLLTDWPVLPLMTLQRRWDRSKGDRRCPRRVTRAASTWQSTARRARAERPAPACVVDVADSRTQANMLTLRKTFWLASVLAAVLDSSRANPQIVVPLKLSQQLAVVMVKIDGTDVPLL